MPLSFQRPHPVSLVSPSHCPLAQTHAISVLTYAPLLRNHGNNFHILHRPETLLDLDEKQPLRRLPLHIHQVNEPVPLLQAIQTDACPRTRGVLGVLFVFDFESMWYQVSKNQEMRELKEQNDESEGQKSLHGMSRCFREGEI